MGGDPQNPTAYVPMNTGLPVDGRQAIIPQMPQQMQPMQPMGQFGGYQNSGLSRYLQAAQPVTRINPQMGRYSAPSFGQGGGLGLMGAIGNQRQQQMPQIPIAGILDMLGLGAGVGSTAGSAGIGTDGIDAGIGPGIDGSGGMDGPGPDGGAAW